MKERKEHIDFTKNNNKNPYLVPTDYFSTNAIKLKAISQEETKTKFISLKKISYFVSIAAAIALIVILIKPTQQVEPSLLSNSEMLLLMEDGYLNFSNSDLAYLEIENIEWSMMSQEMATEYLNDIEIYNLEEAYIYNY